jgi:hypothetical protein
VLQGACREDERWAMGDAGGLRGLGTVLQVVVGFDVVKRFEVGLTLYSIQPAVFVCSGET